MKIWSEISLSLNTLKIKFGEISVNASNPAVKNLSNEEVRKMVDPLFSEIVQKIQLLQDLKKSQEGGMRNEEKEKEVERLKEEYRRNIIVIQKKILEYEQDRVKHDVD